MAKVAPTPNGGDSPGGDGSPAAGNPSTAAGMPSAAISASPSSAFGLPKPGKIMLTRMQLLEYLHQRSWWRVAQYNLFLTALLWGTFVAQIYLRADVEDAFKVKDGMVQHIEKIVAHPTISGVPFMQQEEVEVPCRCACRSVRKGTPPSVCSTPGAEILDFAGVLGPNETGKLLNQSCSDMAKPLADLRAFLSWNASNYSCPEWFESMGRSLGSTSLAKETMCTRSKYEAFLLNRSTAKEWVNDTDNHILFQLKDFELPRWTCPSMCDACQYNIAHGMAPLMLGDIHTVEDVWLWVEHGLVPDIFSGETHNPLQKKPGVLGKKNLLIAGLRARQLRHKTDACNVLDSLKQIYTPTCRSPEPALSYDPPGEPNSLQAFMLKSTGAYTPATDEEGAFDTFFEVDGEQAATMDTVTKLRRAQWLDSSASVLRIEGLAVNAETGFFALLTVSFTFTFDGVVLPSLTVEMLQIINKFVWIDYLPEFLWLGLIAIILLQEIFQIFRTCWQRRVKEYFCNGWNYVDWVAILLGFGLVGLWFILLLDSISLTDKVVSIPRSVPSDSASLNAYRSSWTSLLEDARALRGIREIYLFVMFIYSFIITLRFMKAFLGQQKLAMIQNSLAWAAKDVLHFQIVFVVMFVTFVLGGHVLFGVALKEWSTVAGALSATIKILMGGLHFEEMFDYAPWSATVWFWLFLFTMTFLMLQLLTAMLVVHFGKFRRMIGPTDTIFIDFWEGFRDFLWRSEWRWDNIMMREFMGAVQNPYEDLLEGVTEKAEVSETMEELMSKSVLGIRLAQAREDVKSIGGMRHENPDHPSIEFVKEKAMQKELRQIGADATVADHLITECDKTVKKHASRPQGCQDMDVERARFFLRMLRQHGDKLAFFCDKVESGVEEEMTNVIDGLEVLEDSIKRAFDGLKDLSEKQVDSLALCPPRLPFTGTSVRDTFMTCLGHQKPRQGTMAIPDGPDLRTAGESDDFFALNDFQLPPGHHSAHEATAVPAALLDHGPGSSSAAEHQIDPNQLALLEGQVESAESDLDDDRPDGDAPA